MLRHVRRPASSHHSLERRSGDAVGAVRALLDDRPAADAMELRLSAGGGIGSGTGPPAGSAGGSAVRLPVGERPAAPLRAAGNGRECACTREEAGALSTVRRAAGRGGARVARGARAARLPRGHRRLPVLLPAADGRCGGAKAARARRAARSGRLERDRADARAGEGLFDGVLVSPLDPEARRDASRRDAARRSVPRTPRAASCAR